MDVAASGLIFQSIYQHPAVMPAPTPFSPLPFPPSLRASDRCLATLRARILSLELEPGAKLDEALIARAHGVSRTPAREALLALAQEGLVSVRPQAGTFVALIDGEALAEIMEARRVLEELLARRAAERAAPGEVFREALRAGREAARLEDAGAFLRADHEFHAALARAANGRRIGRLTLEQRAAIDRFRVLTPLTPSRMKRAADEHEAIAAEIAQGEAKAAARAMRRHLAGRGDDIAAARAAYPAYFISQGGSP